MRLPRSFNCKCAEEREGREAEQEAEAEGGENLET